MPNYNSTHTGSEIDGAVTKVNDSGVTQTELSYLDGLSSNVQTQLGLKAALDDNTQNIIANNITVHGTLLTKDSQNVNIGDAIITLNYEEAGTPTENAGIEVERGTSTNVLLRWNETADRWEFTNDGTTYYNIPISTEYATYVSSDFTHDDLTGFVANEHIDHSTITLTAGTGLSGGGDITASRSFAVDLNQLTTKTTIADEDFIAMVDATDSGSGKITFENLEDAIFASVSGDILITEAGVATIQANSVALATDTTGDYVNSITGGTGIDSTGATSGENISHTLSLDLNELTTETTIADADFIAMVDATDSGSGKITFAQFRSSIPSNNLFDGLADPDEDKIPYWKDGTGNPAWVTIGSGLSFSSGTLDTAAVTVDRFTDIVTDERRGGTALTAQGDSDTLDFLGGSHISTSSSQTGSVVQITINVDDASVNADTVDSLHASSFIRSDAADSFSGKLTWTQGATDGIDMDNGNIVNVNNLTFHDPGVNEGLQWVGGNGWKIYESPNGLTNAAGNLQFVTTSTRRMTLDTSGNLDVTGNITAVAGTFSGVLTNTGGSKITVQNTVDGGNSRGIFMWNDTDTNWGIYMGQSGASKSLSGGTAVAGDGFTAHALRFRVADNATQGFVWENASEELLMSLRSSDGNFWLKGNITAGGFTWNGTNLTAESASDAPIITKSTDGTTGIQFRDSNSTAGRIYYVGSGNYFYMNNSAKLYLRDSGSANDITLDPEGKSIFVNELQTSDKLTCDTITGLATNFDISQSTTDGVDAGRTRVNGGGAAGDTRGGYIELHGNEHSNTGQIRLLAGNVTGGEIRLYTSGLERFTVEKGGTTVINASLVSKVTGNSDVGLRIQRASASGRAQYTLENESGTQLWRCGLTGGGGTDYVFWNTSANALILSYSNNSATFAGDVQLNKSIPYLNIGNNGNTTSASIRLGGDNSSGGRMFFQYNGDSSYIDCYGGHGSTEIYRNLSINARNLYFKTGSATQALYIDNDQNATFTGYVAVGGDTKYRLNPATGDYGTFKVVDGVHPSWIGYAIRDDFVFMGTTTNCGIYNDTNNEWMIQAQINDWTRLYHNGSNKLETTSTGILINGGTPAIDFGTTAKIDITSTYAEFDLDNGKIGYLSHNNSARLRWNSSGVTIQNGTFTADSSGTFGGDVTIQNSGDATLWIRADTDNVTETDNATLRISQDGDLVNFYIGTDSNNGSYFQAYDYFAWKNSGGTERMRLTNAGELRCDADVIAYYSDARLKDFHGVIENPIEKIMKLNGYYFTENAKAKELGFDNDRMQVGVSAQEIEQVLPELIKDAPIGYGYKTIDYGKITPLLIEAIKEQQKQINELKRQVGEA